MLRCLKAQNKQGFVDCTLTLDKTESSKTSKWERANVVVCTWILGSISESIYSILMYSDK